MPNVWNVTEKEYRMALKLTRDASTSLRDNEAYWQLCRYYRGQIFHRDDAARGVLLIRQQGERGNDTDNV